MYELNKIGKVFTSKSVRTGPSSYEKRIYRAAVSQSLRNTGLDSEPDFDEKMNRFQRICGTIRKHPQKTRTDTQMKIYKFIARPTLRYGSETCVTAKRDLTRLEATEMRFLRSVKGYTRLDKIRSEVIRKELETSGIRDERSKYKQNWINRLERMDNTGHPKHGFR